jgi:hypothetical protein
MLLVRRLIMASCHGWWSDEACSTGADSPEINIDAVKNCLYCTACTVGSELYCIVVPDKYCLTTSA